MQLSIELPMGVQGVDCVVRSTDDGDVGSAHLDFRGPPGVEEVSDKPMSQGLETLSKSLSFTISWRIVKAPLKRSQGTPEVTQMLSDLNSVEEVASVNPQVQAEMLSILNELRSLSWSQFRRYGRLKDLEDAIDALQKAIPHVPEDHPDMPAMLSDLGVWLKNRFQFTGNLADVREAIVAHQKAIRLSPPDHPTLYGMHSNLGLSFLSLSERTGNVDDMAEAVSSNKEAVRLIPKNDRNMPRVLSNLASSLQRRFEHTGDVTDLSEAVDTYRKAKELMNEGDGSLPGLLVNFAASLGARFERSGDDKDSAEALSAVRKAEALLPADHPCTLNALGILGRLLMARFERNGVLDELSESISVHQRVIRLTPPNHSILPHFWSILGASFAERFQRIGSLPDISEAIFLLQRAVRATAEDHPELPNQLCKLGGAFRFRFSRTGNLSDIQEAVEIQRKAVDITPTSHADLPLRLNDLGVALALRFRGFGETSDISEALSSFRRALKGISDGHLATLLLLDNLGNIHQERFEFEHCGNMADINEAIVAHKKAVDSTQKGHADLGRRFNNLGTSYITRFKCTGNLEDSTEAIEAFKCGVDLVPDGFADRSVILSNLAAASLSRALSTGSAEDMEITISHFRRAATSTLGPTSRLVFAATHWARLLNEHYPDSPDIIVAFDTAIQKVGLMVGLDQTIQNQLSQMQDLPNISLEASSSALRLSKPQKALEWLEHGRCFMWSQLQRLRSPLDELRVYDPDLASEISDVAKQLEDAGSTRRLSAAEMSWAGRISIEDGVRKHVRLAEQWARLVNRVKDLPGFASLLQPKLFSTLIQDLPTSGFVVVINMSDARCDAIALQSGVDVARHIPLSSFNRQKAKKCQEQLRRQLGVYSLRGGEDGGISEEGSGERVGGIYRRGRRGSRSEVQQLLHCLWIDVVKPIIMALGIPEWDGSKRGPIPRIWWCPTSTLSSLPIHAAGTYDDLHSEGVLDFVVSSYTPTISSLIQRLKNDDLQATPGSGLFLTSHPTVAGLAAIPGTVREVDSIYESAEKHGINAMKVHGDLLSVEDCLRHMEEFSSVHFACHARQDEYDPMKSRFRFHHGQLDLDTIAKRNLKNAELAFLSACETARGEERLP
ncbi:TPR-like protein [Coprinellus micaceus]|uniref:TPR-like protein n=1 Tax=Coprinellus micaceus TaxID=71717 RepID=A0A4Y7T006_COPMI|nr:TPR-like protein [Coprinellus micaceus]